MTFEEFMEKAKKSLDSRSRGYLYDMEDYPEDAKCGHAEILNQDRWSITKRVVHEYQGRYLAITWYDPATEMQDGQDTFAKAFEVRPIEKVITDWETV